MEIDPNDWMDRAFYLGTYDPALASLIRRHVRRGDHCVDVGAQKGYVTLMLSQRVGPPGKVFAFEPDPRAFEVLKLHRERNHQGQIMISPYALGKTHGKHAFALSNRLGWSSFFPNRIARESVASTLGVPVRGLDRLVSDGELDLDPDRLTFVKIDAEGAEPLVLAGMAGILRRSRPVLWIEINRESLEAGGFSTSDIEVPLRDLGFTLLNPRSVRRLGVRRFELEPLSTLDSSVESVFNVVALKG